MQYGLTHPSHVSEVKHSLNMKISILYNYEPGLMQGYYMKQDVFGSHGDFITSPEISQVFGEVGLTFYSWHFSLEYIEVLPVQIGDFLSYFS